MSPMTNERIYEAKALRDWVAAVFAAAGTDADAAAETARVLVRTNLRGIDTHGVVRVLAYVEKIRSGEVNAKPKLRSEHRDGVLFVDGDGGLGQAVAMQAVREAVELARESAVVTCMIRGSGHLSALGQFVLEAAERGMVALLCQETPPLMALAGAGRPAIGNNPLAFAAPVAEQAPLVFDMAASVVARGNVLQATKDKLSSIPEGWAIGPDGLPTTDPAVALKGAMLPIAAHKGIGLAMMVQVLAGSLNGSATAASAAQHGSTGSAGNVSAFLQVINPDRLIGRAQFDQHMAAWLQTYLSHSGAGSRYPGQRAAECEVERTAQGIPVSDSIAAELRRAGELVGVAFHIAESASGAR